MPIKKPNLLFILPGPVPPDLRPSWNEHVFLSKDFNVYVIQSVWPFFDEDGNKIKDIEISGVKYKTSSFGYSKPRVFRLLFEFFFYLKSALSISKECKVDVVITYGTTKTGVFGFLIKKLLNAKLLIGVPGIPKDAYFFDEERIGIKSKILNKISLFFTKFILKKADFIKLLYKEQLVGIDLDLDNKINAFSDTVPINEILSFRKDKDEKYILFVGYPWYLKGVDLLIKAFKNIKRDFPDYKLKIYGHPEGKSYFLSLAEGIEDIEFGKGVKRDEVMELISNCSLFVLPSRTEAMGRVLLETMVLKKPIVASNVGGISKIIKDRENGLLFETENYKDLEAKIREVLSNPSLKKRIIEGGVKRIETDLSIESYLKNYKLMIDKVLTLKN